MSATGEPSCPSKFKYREGNNKDGPYFQRQTCTLPDKPECDPDTSTLYMKNKEIVCIHNSKGCGEGYSVSEGWTDTPVANVKVCVKDETDTTTPPSGPCVQF